LNQSFFSPSIIINITKNTSSINETVNNRQHHFILHEVGVKISLGDIDDKNE